jgi:hypothetical protein
MKLALFGLLIVVVALVVCARIARLFASVPAPRRGWLDDDGVKRGPCWDGSWLSGPRAASVPA